MYHSSQTDGAMKLTLLLVLSAVIAFAVADDHCISNNGEMFLNRCFVEYPSGFLQILANLIQQWINPRFLAQVGVAVTIFLPFLYTHFGFSYTANARKYKAMRLSLINFLHRFGYTLVLDVGLYAMFRQRRPCSCPVPGQGYVQIGSLYGMPSGDAMSGAVFGIMLVEKGYGHRIWGRVAGVLFIIWVCFERVVLGAHSIGQVTAGATIGIALHFYSTSVPQYFILVDTAVQVIAGLIALFLDPALVFKADDGNNLFGWFFWGLSIQVFTLVVYTRHYWLERFVGIKVSYRNQMRELEAPEGSMLLNGDASQEIPDTYVSPTDLPTLYKRLDFPYLAAAVIGMLGMMLFSQCITHYNLMAGH